MNRRISNKEFRMGKAIFVNRKDAKTQRNNMDLSLTDFPMPGQTYRRRPACFHGWENGLVLHVFASWR
jgi:hypothetical protein